MGALWRPLGLLHFLVCATRVLQWASNKRQKQFKINGLGRFLGTLLGRPIWTIPTKNTFPCSAALVLDLREAFSCSVALVFGFLMAGHDRTFSSTDFILFIERPACTKPAARQPASYIDHQT